MPAKNRVKTRTKSGSQEGLVYSTTKRRPFKLIYYEACINEDDARTRETYLKSGMGKRYIRNRLKFFFNNTSF